MPWTAAHPLTRLDLGVSIDSLFNRFAIINSSFTKILLLLLRWRLLNLVSCVILYCTMKVTQRNTVANVLVSPLVLASLLILLSPFSVARLCQQIAALFGVYCASSQVFFAACTDLVGFLNIIVKGLPSSHILPHFLYARRIIFWVMLHHVRRGVNLLMVLVVYPICNTFALLHDVMIVTICFHCTICL